MKKNIIICISREYGSGGKELAERLGEKLGISVYDKEIISQVAQESGMSEEFVQNHEENPVYSHILCVPMGHPASDKTYEGIMTPEKLFHVQSQVIQKIAKEEGSCIFVGRCADIILQNHENSYTFFIHRPKEDRIHRLMDIEGMSEKEAKKMVKKTDKERSTYHDFYTGIKWGHPSNYHMILNLSKMSMDQAVSLIEEYVR